MRNFKLLCHFAKDSAFLSGPIFTCTVRLWGQMVSQVSPSGNVLGTLGQGPPPCLGHQGCG